MAQEFLYPYLFFLLKVLTVVFAIIFILVKILKSKSEHSDSQNYKIIKVKTHYEKKMNALKLKILGSKKYKKEQKILKKNKNKNKKEQVRNKLFILKFKGDIQASQVETLRDQISLILSVVSQKDEVLVCLESPGGVVNGYGLAASQFERIKNKGIKLTVAIDRVAASGGYLMACVAHQILAAPFAMIGSIGVVGQIPNFHRLLKKNNVDMELHTAGNYKRTLTLFGKNTEQGRNKFKKDLEEIHTVFKDFVFDHRSKLNIKEVATGEVWLGKQALSLGLVDRVITSDDYIIEELKNKDVFLIEKPIQKNLKDRLFKTTSKAIENAIENIISKVSQRFF